MRCASERAGERRRVFTQFGNGGGLPVPGTQPGAQVVQPIYRETLARNGAPVFSNVDTQRE